jgi:hypothetical protein
LSAKIEIRQRRRAGDREEKPLVQAYKTEAIIQKEGELCLQNLPFQAGDEVEVILLRRELKPARDNQYPFRGVPIRYEDPTSPVAEDD